MSSRAEPRRRRFGLSNGVALLLACGLPLPALAQLAPVAGEHRAARASDTGFGGVSASGGYSTAVPLDLPSTRDGLPLPLQVVSGGMRVGAAGLGWDVPLSYIYRSNTTAYRRPAPQPFSVTDPEPLLAPERLTLLLNGATIELVRNAADDAWVARNSNQIEVRELTSETLEVYDGNGLVYTFDSSGATPGSHLAGGDLFLLRTITGSGVNNRVELGYAISAPALPGGGAGLAINLTTLRYNLHPTTADCAKHEVLLNYDTPASTPLALSVLGSTVLAQVNKLSSVRVNSYEACGDAPVALAQYSFTYQPDADTQQPRLQQVTMTGQEGTSEENVTLPVATYTYGRISDGGQITFEKIFEGGPPISGGTADVYGVGINTAKATISGSDLRVETHTPQTLLDENGDGRSDYLNHYALDLTLLNQPDGLQPRAIQLTQSSGFESRGAIAQTTYLNTVGQSSVQLRLNTPNARTEIFRRHIDMNGDGRLDEIEASSADPDHWTVRLNVPLSLFNSVPRTRRIPVAQVRSALAAAGTSISGRIPLGKSATVGANPEYYCYLWSSASAVWVRGSFCDEPKPAPRAGRHWTITEWDLQDVNGDGYPDFVYNASPVVWDESATPPAEPGTTDGETTWSPTLNDLSGSRDIKVLINTGGVHFDTETSIFASPITLVSGATDACGVARWQGGSSLGSV